MRVLGLDPGTHLGWCLVDEKGARLDSGVIDLDGHLAMDDRSALWAEMGWLLARQPRDLVAYERVHRHSGVHAAHMYGGQVAIIQHICTHLGVPWTPVQVATVKAFLQCRASGKDKKKAMVDAAHRLGYPEVKDHNEADALGVALAGVRQWREQKQIFNGQG